jgi:enediyne biosynthesis protein E4
MLVHRSVSLSTSVAVALVSMVAGAGCTFAPSGQAAPGADGSTVADAGAGEGARQPGPGGPGDAQAMDSRCSGQPEGAACDDGDACTQIDECRGGRCVGAMPRQCAKPGQCRLAGTCEAATGECVYPPVPNGRACDDGSECTARDRCQDGQCRGDVQRPWAVRCSAGICFTEVAQQSGIDWQAHATAGRYLGAGAAFIDYNGDQAMDLLLGSETSSPVLYRNLGNGTFEDVTVAVGLPALSSELAFSGFAAADYDNDGYVDLFYATAAGGRLFRNRGGAMFVEVTEQAGILGGRWSIGAAFADYDGDGDLDLYVGNYIDKEGAPAKAAANQLYRNDGDGTFTDVAGELMVAGAGATRAVAWTHTDDDRWPDLLVCNDRGQFAEPNRLYRNHAGQFVDVSAAEGAELQVFCAGIAAGDYDRDGDFDYYFTSLGRNVLLRNDLDKQRFIDVTTAAQAELAQDACYPDRLAAGWGVGFQDFDRDGWLDLFVANGHVPADDSLRTAERSRNALLRHSGHLLRFDDVTVSAGLADDGIGRGVAFADYDSDGDVDILQVNLVGRPRLWRNDSPGRGHYLTVQLTGRQSNRHGIGARLSLEAGQFALVREVSTAVGYASASSPAVHFGLGRAEPRSLVVRWPSGIRQRLLHLEPDVAVNVVEPAVTIEGDEIRYQADDSGVSVVVPLRNRTGAPVTAYLRALTMLSTRATQPRPTPPAGGSDHARVAGTDQPAAQQAAPPEVPVSISLDADETAQVTISLPGQRLARAGAFTVPLFIISVHDAGGGLDEAVVMLQAE